MADPRGGPRPRMRRADYLAASQSAERFTTRFFIVLLRDRKDGGRTRLGVTVTRKVGHAVRRNRIKRLAREWFRTRSHELGPCDLVLIAKRELPQSLRLADLREDLDRALERRAARGPRS